VQVLLLGESGTGKELIARALHDAGARAGRPFVTVDCAALSPTLFANELFGHEKGAFTGADRRHSGAFERANGGTVFLDEVGELPTDMQAALLGVLERRRVKRLGGVDEIPVDVRVVSATHRDILAEVNASTFRLDLFYRLAVVRIRVPALRERPDDVPMLVAHFLLEAGFEGSIEDIFPPDALEALGRHSWPGNVRELRNAVLGTLALGAPPELLDLSPPSSEEHPFDALLGRPYREAKRTVTDGFERHYLRDLLDRNDGNVSKAAKDARMDRKYLTELLRRHGLK
jgi:DNA-binding NtrC family response regulator